MMLHKVYLILRTKFSYSIKKIPLFFLSLYKSQYKKYINICMGCSSPTNAGIPAQVPSIPQSHLNRLLQVTQIGHPLNVNKKYEHIIRIDQTQQVGTGYRRTYGYHCLTTLEQLQQKVKQFWDTRTSGQDKTWKVLKNALAMPNGRFFRKKDKQAVSYIRSNQIQMLNESVQMCIDSKHYKYEIPVFCINPPLTISQVKIQEKGLALEFSDEDVEVIVRSTKYPNGDIKMNLKLSMSIEEIKNKIKEDKQLKAETKIRFFYQGREMLDHNYLGSYKYVSGLVIQAMIN